MTQRELYHTTAWWMLWIGISIGVGLLLRQCSPLATSDDRPWIEPDSGN